MLIEKKKKVWLKYYDREKHCKAIQKIRAKKRLLCPVIQKSK